MVRIGILIQVMKTQPEAEAVGEGDLLLGGFTAVDGGRTFVLDHIPRHHVPTIRGSIEDGVARTTFQSTFKNGL